MKKFYSIPLIITAINSLAYAKSSTEVIGDVFSGLIPLTAYGTTLYLDDKNGQTQFYKSYASTMGATYVLKYTVREKRPDSNNKDSFPSGHTSSAFSGASFIHKRYGLKYAILPYMAAIYTGYSRVKTNKHHPIDVFAGAALGILSSWYFVTPYENLQMTPIVDNSFKGFNLSYKW